MTPSYVVKLTSGRVMLYRSSGAFVRIICSGARSAVVQGDEVHVTMPDNRVRVYRASTGSFQRTI